MPFKRYRHEFLFSKMSEDHIKRNAVTCVCLSGIFFNGFQWLNSGYLTLKKSYHPFLKINLYHRLPYLKQPILSTIRE